MGEGGGWWWLCRVAGRVWEASYIKGVGGFLRCCLRVYIYFILPSRRVIFKYIYFIYYNLTDMSISGVKGHTIARLWIILLQAPQSSIQGPHLIQYETIILFPLQCLLLYQQPFFSVK